MDICCSVIDGQSSTTRYRDGRMAKSIGKQGRNDSIKQWNVDYDNLLKSCKLPTLVSRRHYLKLSFLYQVINGSFTFPNAPLERRSISSNLRSTASSLLLQRPRTHTNAYQYSFFPHAIALWNNLPPSLHSSLLNVTII